VKTENVLTIGVVAIGVYFVYRAIQEMADVKDKLADVGSAIGSGLFDFFHPDQVGETIFYSVTFPKSPIADGQRHAVPSRSVNAQGQFTLPQFFGSTRWQLLKGKDGMKYAAKV
jgi:hypothetical protein